MDIFTRFSYWFAHLTHPINRQLPKISSADRPRPIPVVRYECGCAQEVWARHSFMAVCVTCGEAFAPGSIMKA
jgi:hypothetical protein